MNLNKKFSTLYPRLTREVFNDCKYFEFTYKQGKGHFKVMFDALITGFNQTEFKKVVSMMESSDNSQTLAGYLNSFIKKVYDLFNAELKNDDPDKKEVLDFLKKKNAILVKAFRVAPIEEVKPAEVPVEENENITELKKCNVIRYIPTQVKPIWENGTIENHIGYHFTYRGMPLQAYTTDGWCNKRKTTTVFIVDPVLGLPITHYTGALADIEEILANVFIGYLKTIESNKESIVLIARAFDKLKTA